MDRKRATITDVARRAHVSVGTVSNVLNGTVYVSEERRDRVLKAIQELGFKQNMLAQGLRRRRSPVIGVCVPHTSIAYFSALVDAFEEMASSRGFEIMQVLSRQDPVKEEQRVQALLRYHVGGLIIVPSMEPERTYDHIAASDVPVVVVDRPTDAYPFDQVTFDNRSAMCEAVRKLIELGHRRVLFGVKQRQLIVTRQRIAGLNEAVRETAEPVTTSILECADDEAHFVDQLRSALQRPNAPTAIVVSNSALAAWMLRALRELGVRCPEDVSLLAFDEPEWADLVTPQLSVVRQPTKEIARKAWEFLINRINGEAPQPQRVELEAQLVLRDSVRPLLPAERLKRRRRAS